MKQIIRINTEREYNSYNNELNMLQEASDRAILLCRQDKYEIGTTALLMKSGLIEVVGTKTSEYGLTLKVSIAYNKRKYRKADIVYHDVFEAICKLQDDLVKIN